MTKVVNLNQIKLERMYEQQLKTIFVLHNQANNWCEIINKGEDNNDNTTSK